MSMVAEKVKRVCGDRLMLRLVTEKRMTEGGIHLPDSAKQRGIRGIVVAVGDGVAPNTFKEGDDLLIVRFQGENCEVGGDEFLMVSTDSVLAVME